MSGSLTVSRDRRHVDCVVLQALDIATTPLIVVLVSSQDRAHDDNKSQSPSVRAVQGIEKEVVILHLVFL